MVFIVCKSHVNIQKGKTIFYNDVKQFKFNCEKIFISLSDRWKTMDDTLD